ncbi:MAG: TIGR02281 family clan AA aspartic protease [Rickettsiales bacterium]|nr:TIGR02281 family clan AA aspartic protease [Rickettsiales bacterium]
MFNLDSNTLASLIYQILFLGMLISSLFIRTTTNRSNKLKHLAIWLSVIFVGVIFYNNRNMFHNFIPYVANTSEEGKIEIQKSSDNHFYIMLKVNNKNILFLIDTGATTTSLTLKDAKRIGIDVNNLKYNQMVNTANGTAFGASAKISNIQVGNFKIEDMWVLINQNMSGNSLLGMNFLKQLSGYEVRQDKMILYFQ